MGGTAAGIQLLGDGQRNLCLVGKGGLTVQRCPVPCDGLAQASRDDGIPGVGVGGIFIGGRFLGDLVDTGFQVAHCHFAVGAGGCGFGHSGAPARLLAGQLLGAGPIVKGLVLQGEGGAGQNFIAKLIRPANNRFIFIPFSSGVGRGWATLQPVWFLPGSHKYFFCSFRYIIEPLHLQVYNIKFFCYVIFFYEN